MPEAWVGARREKAQRESFRVVSLRENATSEGQTNTYRLASDGSVAKTNVQGVVTVDVEAFYFDQVVVAYRLGHGGYRHDSTVSEPQETILRVTSDGGGGR